MVFAITSAPLSNVSRLPHVVLWILLHLLHFNVANQILGTEEDERNKSFRPLPAKRISLAQAVIFRWFLVPACLLLSLLYGLRAVYPSISLIALTFIYNELGGHDSHWAIRNLLNALGFTSFAWGATLLARSDQTLDGIATWAMFIEFGLLVTTIHAQDFEDEHGDRAIGRKTIPVVFGHAAKYSVIVPLLAWSLGLSAMWCLDVATSFCFMLLAALVGLQYIAGRTIQDYKVAYRWYNVWVSVAHILPAYYRTFV